MVKEWRLVCRLKHKGFTPVGAMQEIFLVRLLFQFVAYNVKKQGVVRRENDLELVFLSLQQLREMGTSKNPLAKGGLI